jgi:predicted negative regulator of RcsB-dependent stress response
MKRLLILVLVIATVAAIGWGIWYLEAMRKQSAQEARINNARLIETAPTDAGQQPR